MTQLKMLYSSNAFWAASGYGVQGRSLLPRLADLPEFAGRDNIAMFAWYGLHGGVHYADGFRVYPGANDAYGNDIIGAHARDFGANLVITLIDAWVLQNTARAVRPAIWCVPGYTLVSLGGGRQVQIKDLHDDALRGVSIHGHDGQAPVVGEIQGYHYVGIKPTMEIETATGRRLRTTAESGVYVQRNGGARWVQASSIIPGDMVYCIAGDHIQRGDQDDQLGAQAHDGMAVSGRHQADGNGVFGGHLGWRGCDQYSRSHEAAPYCSSERGAIQNSSARCADLQLQQGLNRLAALSHRIPSEWSGSAEGENVLPDGNIRVSQSRSFIATGPVLDCEATPSIAGDGVHRDQGAAIRHGIQSNVRAAGSGDLADAARVELEEVRSVRSTGVSEPVYDLTTSTHNFFANGILIHNCPWLPIDHDPVPDAVLRALEGAHLPLTYAKWGHEMLTDAGVPNHYIPHGVETEVYKILSDRERVNQYKREMTGMDDAHLTVMVAANKGFPDRKAFQVQLRAWAEFAKTRPKARLYLHTEPTTQYGGIDFAALIQSLGLQGKVLFPDRYRNYLGYPPEYLSLTYNMADVFLGASMSEGFGIPLIEAQACGTPVVTTDFSAMPELVRWGTAVKPLDRVWTPMNSWQAWPDHNGITAALEEYYTLWMDTQRGTGAEWTNKARAAQRAIHDEYSWDAIVRDQWAPLIERLAGEAPAVEVRPDAREAVMA